VERTKLKADIGELKRLLAEQKHMALVERKKMDATKQEVTTLEHNLRVCTLTFKITSKF
jgi:hypothetical protein